MYVPFLEISHNNIQNCKIIMGLQKYMYIYVTAATTVHVQFKHCTMHIISSRMTGHVSLHA